MRRQRRRVLRVQRALRFPGASPLHGCGHWRVQVGASGAGQLTAAKPLPACPASARPPALPWLLPRCLACAHLNSQCGGGDACVRCTGTGSCAQCMRGWFLDPSSTCQPCPAGCMECTSATNCTRCMSGMGVVDGVCRNCTQPHCLSCDGDASRCLSCGTEEGVLSGQEPGPAYFADAASGACVPVSEPTLLLASGAAGHRGVGYCLPARVGHGDPHTCPSARCLAVPRAGGGASLHGLPLGRPVRHVRCSGRAGTV